MSVSRQARIFPGYISSSGLVIQIMYIFKPHKFFSKLIIPNCKNSTTNICLFTRFTNYNYHKCCTLPHSNNIYSNIICHYVCLLIIGPFKEAFWINYKYNDSLTLSTSPRILREQHFLKCHIVLQIIKFRKFNINKIQLIWCFLKFSVHKNHVDILLKCESNSLGLGWCLWLCIFSKLTDETSASDHS